MGQQGERAHSVSPRSGRGTAVHLGGTVVSLGSPYTSPLTRGRKWVLKIHVCQCGRVRTSFISR